MNDQQMIAHMRGDEPAKQVSWYLPLAGREHIEYPDRDAAAKAAVRVCVEMGVPLVTPLSRRTNKENA